MIDLRSDTLTKPIDEMLQSIIHAEVGDDGRTNPDGKGEDPTVNKLERLAATITGHEDALFCNSGTMANIVALLTYCSRGDTVLIDKYSHIAQSETAIFSKEYFGLNGQFYQTNDYGVPCMTSIEKNVREKDIKLIGLENSVSYQGGTCISHQDMTRMCEYANKVNVPVHVDGARIVNVAAHYDMPISNFTSQANSVQICLSKGLGAPVGSVLCGSKAFIRRARGVRKEIGGGMRQAGIIASAGIVALKKGLEQAKIDNANARLLAEGIRHNYAINLNMETVQTNIIICDVSPSGYTAQQFSQELSKKGVHVRPHTASTIRMIVYREINEESVLKLIDIINDVCQGMTE